MNDNDNGIDYGALIISAYLGITKSVLETVATDEDRLGKYELYVTFRTGDEGVHISDTLLKQYDTEMTIVLQNQYENLIVNEDSFEIDMSFDGVMQTLVIPFASIAYFQDRIANFMYGVASGDADMVDEDFLEGLVDIDEAPELEVVPQEAEIIQLDAFRKKKDI